MASGEAFAALKAVRKRRLRWGGEFEVFESNRVTTFEAAFAAMSQKNVAGLLSFFLRPIFAGNPRFFSPIVLSR